MDRDQKVTRTLQADLKTREEQDGQDLYIEGYFAVFNRETELFPGGYEELASEAFNETLGNDIRALINHDSRLVLGRNKSGTLELKVDAHGLWGRAKINRFDSDAMNMYARVQRRDVDQCSFGFNILEEQTEFREDGTVKWTIRKVDLHEVSVCTFPAYADTGVQARKEDLEQHKVRRIEQRKHQAKERLKRWH
ncbi:HK97 family phage prohead protease [Paenibacillus wenxiniae]|uniref:HK97 family phage prohead protease n=1 Tax=Paenibacillus wenxiniae TaxID=1636843 RepID=A0ABW4RHC4_9BACL